MLPDLGSDGGGAVDVAAGNAVGTAVFVAVDRAIADAVDIAVGSAVGIAIWPAVDCAVVACNLVASTVGDRALVDRHNRSLLSVEHAGRND